MAEAYIVATARTAGGRRNGRLAGWHPADMAGAILDAVVDRTGVDPTRIEDVIMGCVTQAGEQSSHIGRNAVLASGLPDCVPAVSIDRQCGSSQQAVQFAAQAVLSGTQDIVIAAGVESMTRAPMGLSMIIGSGLSPISQKIKDRYGVSGFSQFVGAEMMAEKYGISRDDLDRFALQSHQRAAAAANAGAFAAEIVPLPITLPDGSAAMHSIDEGIRYDATLEGISGVRAVREGGKISAANASQICDGASAVMVVSERALKDHELTPLARIHHVSVHAGDPVIMLNEPIKATQIALQRTGMKIEDIDLYEVNEAFASVPLAWLKTIGADPAKLNVNGGAIALGHPLGASGTMRMSTLVQALRARGKRYGLLAICEGGGIANVTILEALY